jgi:pyruvate dehydrogenase E2 component (dihydrolipoamide acetyltransferase)
MANIALAGKARLSAWRHMSLGTWRTAYDPSIYGSVTLRMDESLRYIAAYREATGRHLTVSHLMAVVAGRVLHEIPEINAVLRWNSIYLREKISVFFQVAIVNDKTGAIDLSGLKLDEPHHKTLSNIIDEFEAKAARIRAHKDKELDQSRGRLHRIPAWFIRPMLNLLAFASYTLNLDLRWAGVPKDPFGSIMVTNIGSLGLEAAYAPLVPFTRVSLLVAMGAVEDVPVVEDGEVKVGKAMRIFSTFDHRVVDGAHAAKMVAILRRHFEDPYEAFGPIPAGDGD